MNESSSRPQPNILILVVDCLRADYCPADDLRPELTAWHRLRRAGTCFTQLISTATNTPVCFGSLLTGLYSPGHGIRTLQGPALRPNVTTLPALLKQAGYHTFVEVTGPLLNVFGLDQGVDHYCCRNRNENVYADWGREFAERFAQRHKNAKPWFELVHFFEVHRPRQYQEVRAPRSAEAKYVMAWEKLNVWLEQFLDRVPDNTIIVLTADHGECIRRPADRTVLGYIQRHIRKFLKLPRLHVDWKNHSFFVYDQLVRIPLLISGPGMAVDKVIKQQVRQIDLAPTLLDLIGQPVPDSMHGRSLKPLLEGRTLPDEPAYVETGMADDLRHWHGIRNEKWKYIQPHTDNPDLNGDEFLFDLARDPQEHHNVIEQYRDIADELKAELVRIVQQSYPADAAGAEMTAEEKDILEQKLTSLGYL